MVDIGYEDSQGVDFRPRQSRDPRHVTSQTVCRARMWRKHAICVRYVYSTLYPRNLLSNQLTLVV